MAAAEPPTDRAHRYTVRILWICSALSAAVAAFLLADIARSGSEYNALAWVGVTLSALAILALTVLYAACALGRLDLSQPIAGKLTLFQFTAICLVVAVGADILIPNRSTGGLALLLPWGITYWLHNLNRPGPDDTEQK
ncbi:MAG TPA: hypothetical protein VGD34_27445 [Kribbella sp.]|jgi:hypothetical protein